MHSSSWKLRGKPRAPPGGPAHARQISKEMKLLYPCRMGRQACSKMLADQKLSVSPALRKLQIRSEAHHLWKTCR